jgi:hypothetical protein
MYNMDTLEAFEMRDTTTLYARLPTELVQLINARAKALNSGYRSSKAYLEDGMQRFLARSPWNDSAPCFPTPRDVRTYGGGQTDWVAYNLILSRDVAATALEAATHLKVSNPSFVLGALLWWLEQSLGESGVSPSRKDLVSIADRHKLPLWSAPRSDVLSSAHSTQRPKAAAKPKRFKSADDLDIPVEQQQLSRIDEVIRGVEGRSKSGRLAAEELVSAVDSFGAGVKALGREAEGTTIECVGQFVGETDPTVRHYTTSATLEYRNDEVWHLVKVVRKTVRSKGGGKTVLQYSPRARVALGKMAARSLEGSVQQLPTLIRKRFATDDLHLWVGLLYQLVTEHDFDRDQAGELLKWRYAREPNGATKLGEAVRTLMVTYPQAHAWVAFSTVFTSGPVTEADIPNVIATFKPPAEECGGSQPIDIADDYHPFRNT